MIKAKAGFILAASLAGLGLPTLAAAQGSTDDEFVSVPGDDGPWYLRRSNCILAIMQPIKPRPNVIGVFWWSGSGPERAPKSNSAIAASVARR